MKNLSPTRLIFISLSILLIFVCYVVIGSIFGQSLQDGIIRGIVVLVIALGGPFAIRSIQNKDLANRQNRRKGAEEEKSITQ